MSAEARPDAATADFGATELGLYVLTIAVWSTSWIAMKFQLGVVEIVVSVFYRFAIAAAIMVVWVWLSRRRARFSLRLHVRFAAMGLLMFSTNFALFMVAAQWVTTGLLAVVFSLVTILNPINAAIFLRQPLVPRVLVAAAIGVAGIGLIFWPEIEHAGSEVATGLVLAIVGAVCFSLGNIVAVSAQREGHPVVSCNAWGIVYGAAFLGLFAVLTGMPFDFDPRAPYVVSLLGMAVLSTVVAFAAYLTLMRRIGPGRAGYATVMFPIGALAISWAFEGYQWTVLAVVGLSLALAGNLLVLRGSRPA